jgi:hypothetical protein
MARLKETVHALPWLARRKRWENSPAGLPGHQEAQRKQTVADLSICKRPRSAKPQAD